jgi:hypothetical protein
MVLMAGGRIDLSTRPRTRNGDQDENLKKLTHIVTFIRQNMLRPNTRFSIYAFFGSELECWGLERFAYSYANYKRWVEIYLNLLSKELRVDVLERGNIQRVVELEEQRFRLHMMFFLNRNKDCKQVIEMLKLSDEDFALRMRETT